MLCTPFLGQASLEILFEGRLLGIRTAEPHVPGISIAPLIYCCCHVPHFKKTMAHCRARRTAARCGSDCDLNSTAEFISQTPYT